MIAYHAPSRIPYCTYHPDGTAEATRSYRELTIINREDATLQAGESHLLISSSVKVDQIDLLGNSCLSLRTHSNPLESDL